MRESFVEGLRKSVPQSSLCSASMLLV